MPLECTAAPRGQASRSYLVRCAAGKLRATGRRCLRAAAIASGKER